MAVPAGQVLPIPPGISLTEAASFPEVACTVWSTVFMMSKLSPGESFLVSIFHLPFFVPQSDRDMLLPMGLCLITSQSQSDFIFMST